MKVVDNYSGSRVSGKLVAVSRKDIEYLFNFYGVITMEYLFNLSESFFCYLSMPLIFCCNFLPHVV